MKKIETLILIAALPTTILSAKQRPNILFIAVDDLRPDVIAYCGNKIVQSPNLDALASEGVMFQQAYCQTPLSMPSRASVLTGYRPESINNTGVVEGRVPENTVTLPALFLKNGYTTVSIGKIYHENSDDPQGWIRRYTDTFISEGEWSGGYCSDYRLKENIATVQSYLQGGRMRNLPTSSIIEIVDKEDDTTPDGQTANHAIEELRKFKESKEPFFLAVGFYRPHMPLTAPKRYWDLYDPKTIELPENYSEKAKGPRTDWDEVRRYGDIPLYGNLPEEKAKEIIQGYYASVSFIDAQIGKVLDELTSLGMDENTIIVLWSDNGWRLGEHGLWSKPEGTDSPTRITLMIKDLRSKIKGGNSSLVELVDIYPTIADLCKIEYPDYVEGHSMVPLLSNAVKKTKDEVYSNYAKQWYSVRSEQYRLILHKGGEIELYDYFSDPNEDMNQANNPNYINILTDLRSKLETHYSL